MRLADPLDDDETKASSAEIGCAGTPEALDAIIGDMEHTDAVLIESVVKMFCSPAHAPVVSWL